MQKKTEHSVVTAACQRNINIHPSVFAGDFVIITSPTFLNVVCMVSPCFTFLSFSTNDLVNAVTVCLTHILATPVLSVPVSSNLITLLCFCQVPVLHLL